MIRQKTVQGAGVSMRIGPEIAVLLVVLPTCAALVCSMPTTGGALGELPATFRGLVPCADCPGIDYQLNLFDDGVFYLGMTYRERGDAAFYDIGSWSIDPSGESLALSGGAETPTICRIVGANTLRLLDRNGEEIPSSLNYDLRRAGEFVAIEPRLDMRGMYFYFADAGLFTECLTGRKMPVAPEGDNAALERAYLKTRRESGEELLASFEGRIEMRPPMEGDDLLPTVVVEKFHSILPGETCQSASTPRQR